MFYNTFPLSQPRTSANPSEPLVGTCHGMSANQALRPPLKASILFNAVYLTLAVLTARGVVATCKQAVSLRSLWKTDVMEIRRCNCRDNRMHQPRQLTPPAYLLWSILDHKLHKSDDLLACGYYSRRGYAAPYNRNNHSMSLHNLTIHFTHQIAASMQSHPYLTDIPRGLCGRRGAGRR